MQTVLSSRSLISASLLVAPLPLMFLIHLHYLLLYLQQLLLEPNLILSLLLLSAILPDKTH